MMFKEKINQIYQFKSYLFNSVVNIEISLTTRCNNQCYFCAPYQPNKVDFDFDLLKKFIEDAKTAIEQKNKKLVLTLAGGDPLLYPNIKELLQLLKTLNIEYILLANPSSFTQVEDYAIDKYLCKSIRFTIVGNRKTQEEIRKKDSIKVVIAKTKYLRLKGFKVNWNFTVTNDNLQDLPEQFNIIKEGQPFGLTFGRVYAIRDSNNYTSIAPSEYKDYLNKILQYYLKNHKQFHLFFKDHLWVPLLIENNLLDPDNAQCLCNLFSENIFVDISGSIYKCPFAKFETNMDIANYNFQQPYVFNPEKSECRNCFAFSGCQGCPASRWHIDKKFAKDASCWVQ